MNYLRPKAWLLSVATLLIITLVSAATPSAAADRKSAVHPVAITIAQLAGPWALTLVGDTGCGISTSYVTFKLNATGLGAATIQSHSSVCGDGTTGPFPFQIQSLNANGSGTANLSCGTGCGWNLIIQVSKNHLEFNVVDVDPLNPNNFLEGIAIHQ